jgi:hypothetical protein
MDWVGLDEFESQTSQTSSQFFPIPSNPCVLEITEQALMWIGLDVPSMFLWSPLDRTLTLAIFHSPFEITKTCQCCLKLLINNFFTNALSFQVKA